MVTEKTINKGDLTAAAKDAQRGLEGAGAWFVEKDPGYNWRAGDQSKEVYTAVLSAIYSDVPLLLIGPTGIGKTIAAMQIAFDLSREGANLDLPVKHKTPVPIIRYQCEKTSDPMDMVWMYTIGEDGRPAIQAGALPMAINAANENGLAVLLIDELNVLKPEAQKALNPLFDERRGVSLGDKRWVLKEDSRLAIIATMNPNTYGYGGINQLNRDLLDRFVHKIPLTYPEHDEEMAVLEKFSTEKPIREKLVMLAQHTREHKGGDSEQYRKPISTRMLCNFLQALNRDSGLFTEERAAINFELRSVFLGEYGAPDEEGKALAKKIEDIFGIKLGNVDEKKIDSQVRGSGILSNLMDDHKA